MSKKEITSSNPSNRKLRTKELIYAGAFGALYIVLMLVIVLGTSMIPVLYLLAPITVGLVCGTVYMLCVLKVKKFGAALILGVLFALCACSNAWFSFVGAVAAALLAELVIKLGNYRSKKLYLLSFVVFNINMACPYMMLSFASIVTRSRSENAFLLAGNALENDWCRPVQEALAGRTAKPVFIAEGLFMYLTLDQIRTFLEVLKANFPGGGILIAEQNCKAMQKNEKHHDTVKNTKAHFMSGTDSGQEIADLTDGFQLVEEHSFNEEMKIHSIRGKLFAFLLPKMNDRWATFRW